MALTSATLNALSQRQNECERQMQSLQSEVTAFQKHFKVPVTELIADIPSSSSLEVPSGKYAITASLAKTPLDIIAAYLVAEKALRSNDSIKLVLVDKEDVHTPKINAPKTEIVGHGNVIRLLYRMAGRDGGNVLESAQIDQWMMKSVEIAKMNKEEFKKFIDTLNEYLQLRSFLVGYDLKACDVSLWGALKKNTVWQQLMDTAQPPIAKDGPINVKRWFTTLEASPLLMEAQSFLCKQAEKKQLGAAKKEKAAAKNQKKTAKKQPQQNEQQNGKGNKKKGKDKNGGKSKGGTAASWDIGISKEEYDGKIVTRFPPEPSGYLHIGHAKAVVINWKVSRQFHGKMVVRLDDTNPAKEKAEFEVNILRDLRTLGVVPDMLSHTSDYFDYYLQCCTRVIEQGHAYCDPTPAADMKDERNAKIENVYRTQSVAENLRLWQEMQKGSEEGQRTCVRIRLDMQSDNGTLRDPTIYRCNVKDVHHRTGAKYRVYPTYDFACPIVDSLEGITHAFRSKEYNERNEQYKQIWRIVCDGQAAPFAFESVGVQQNAPLQLPNMFQFSRLDFARTELSKRKLAKLIERGVVSGWDDPRLPTVQGITRRGLQIEALDKFIMDQAMSDRNTEQEWDKIWAYNYDILDAKVGRYFAVSEDRVLIELSNVAPMSCKQVPLAPPKYEALAGQSKILEVSNRVYVERFEFEEAMRKNAEKQQSRMILMSWAIINVDKVVYADGDGDDEQKRVTVVQATLEATNTDFKGKPPLNWVADNGVNNLVPIKLVELDYIFNYEQRPKEDDEKKMELVLVENTKPTWLETNAFAETAVRSLSKGDIVQFIKLGLFILDKPYMGRADEPAVFIHIPDGKEKKMSKVWQHLSKVDSGIGSKSSISLDAKKEAKQANKKSNKKKKDKKKNKQ
mmetsp:Transcript_13614/g.20546  ORF Transcript_13614/g.20546 Transcript_13614/m.20546 type:complete len:905 (+) Transcript_13614:24-2738(+)